MITLKELIKEYEEKNPDNTEFLDFADLLSPHISSGGNNNGASEYTSINTKS
jgi:hypothetical protein